MPEQRGHLNLQGTWACQVIVHLCLFEIKIADGRFTYGNKSSFQHPCFLPCHQHGSAPAAFDLTFSSEGMNLNLINHHKEQINRPHCKVSVIVAKYHWERWMEKKHYHLHNRSIHGSHKDQKQMVRPKCISESYKPMATSTPSVIQWLKIMHLQLHDQLCSTRDPI
jgi:hypothetical protein